MFNGLCVEKGTKAFSVCGKTDMLQTLVIMR